MAISLCASTASSNPVQGGKCKYAGQSVRAIPIRILSVGKKRSRGVQLMVDDYVEKVKYYCSVEDVQIRSNPRNARDTRAQVDDEDTMVMNIVRSDDWVVMLDERGQDIKSEQMAELLADAGKTGASRLCFCIGGPYGHGRKLRERANVSIKLSSLVLNHQIALLVLMEQLYRLIGPSSSSSCDNLAPDCEGASCQNSGLQNYLSASSHKYSIYAWLYAKKMLKAVAGVLPG